MPLGLRVKLRIEIAETGKVERVDVEQTSGNETFDTSARFAVLKASPLPLRPMRARSCRCRCRR